MKRKEAYMDDLRPIVYLVGIGMGGEDQLTGRAMDCLEAAQVVMGADRTTLTACSTAGFWEWKMEIWTAFLRPGHI